MSLLVRKIEKAKWLQNDIVKGEDVSADAVTNCMKTSGNELRESEAEAKKKEALAAGNANSILIEAEAQAKANIKLAESLTPELVRYKTIEKWNGALSQVSGGSTPFINLSPNK